MVILVIYFVIAFVRIFSVRHSTYDFDTEMKLASENYGEAVDAYFKDGKWKYNIFKIRCPMRELPKVATIML